MLVGKLCLFPALIPRSSPVGPRKTPSIPPLLLGLTQYTVPALCSNWAWSPGCRGRWGSEGCCSWDPHCHWPGRQTGTPGGWHCRYFSMYNIVYRTSGIMYTLPCFRWAWSCVRASDRAADRSEAASVLTSSTPTWLCGTVVFRCGNVVGRCGIVVCRCGIIVCRCGNMVSRWVIEVCRCGISVCRCGIVVCSCTTVATGVKL